MGCTKAWLLLSALWLGVILTFPIGGHAMEIMSTAFTDKGTIPQKYVMPGAGGKNVSLPLSWSDIPGRNQIPGLVHCGPSSRSQ